MNKDNITGFRCHDADACAMGQIPCPTPFICGCAAPGCAVKEGTHKPAEAVHQIKEPAPVTAMDALREAEAALEVAMARILKADPSHSISVTSEAKALAAVRAALAAPAAVAVPDGLRATLIDVIAQGLSGTWHCNRVWEAWHVGTMSQEDFSPVDESDTPTELADAVLAALAATPATVNQQLTIERAEFEKWLGIKPCGAAHDFGWAAWKARSALSATPEAVKQSLTTDAVLPEPVEFQCRVKPDWDEKHPWTDWEKCKPESASDYLKNPTLHNWTYEVRKLFTEQQVRALLATGGQAQAQAVASIYVTEDGQRECDDWKVPLPVGRNLLYAAPQAQADARCVSCNYQHGHAIGCKNNPVDIALKNNAAAIAAAKGNEQ